MFGVVGLRVYGFMASSIRGLVFCVFGFVCMWLCGFVGWCVCLGLRDCGFVALWLCDCVDLWVSVCVFGFCVCGFVALWIVVCLRVCVLTAPDSSR